MNELLDALSRGDNADAGDDAGTVPALKQQVVEHGVQIIGGGGRAGIHRQRDGEVPNNRARQVLAHTFNRLGGGLVRPENAAPTPSLGPVINEDLAGGGRVQLGFEPFVDPVRADQLDRVDVDLVADNLAAQTIPAATASPCSHSP